MEAMCTLLPYFSWAFFAGFRVYALTDRNTILAAIATILTATYVIPDMYEYTHRTFVNPPHCSQSYDLGPVFLSLLWLSRIGTLIGESIVILVTLRKTYPARSRSPLGCAASRYITDVILSNGIACFSIPLAFNVVMTAMALKGTPTSLLIGQCLACFRDSLSSILISRFLLDIGRLRTDISSGTSESVLTTHFASELSGVTYTLDLSLDSVGERSS
ncbi:hypothetical protein C8Q76DRAFT_758710 [Earliella scabrosa]|nr:hypothetical protein C8Q76DRAFT_758710 [Earliella scabrosa]